MLVDRVGSALGPRAPRATRGSTGPAERAANDAGGIKFRSLAELERFIERNNGTITLAPGASFIVFLESNPRLLSTTHENIRGFQFPSGAFSVEQWLDQPYVTLHRWACITADPRARPGKTSSLSLVREKDALTTSTTVVLTFSLKVS